ncbi:uncharacterized protein LOC110103053 [Dendrobium catenatum]|uniref:uncharacterized protein LOC110103053 n=1 Tax=Dendrobium catenatum TaxID=906689 RepID=UPI00109F1957|nr:uncharacterized protein LOC110103053 [Dendrobium catenatum]
MFAQKLQWTRKEVECMEAGIPCQVEIMRYPDQRKVFLIWLLEKQEEALQLTWRRKNAVKEVWFQILLYLGLTGGKFLVQEPWLRLPLLQFKEERLFWACQWKISPPFMERPRFISMWFFSICSDWFYLLYFTENDERPGKIPRLWELHLTAPSSISLRPDRLLENKERLVNGNVISKYLSQIYTVPKMVEYPELDNQEWLFNLHDSLQKSKIELKAEKIPQVFAQATRIDSADILALPYVVPF